MVSVKASTIIALIAIVFIWFYKQTKFQSMMDTFYHMVNMKLIQHNMKIDYLAIDNIHWSEIYNQQHLHTISKQEAINKLKSFMTNYTLNHPSHPFLIRHDNQSFISKYWKILQKWNPSYFEYGPKIQRRTLGSFEIYSQSHPVFKTFHDNKPFEPYLSHNALKFDDFNTLMLVRSFTAKIFHKSNDNDIHYSYYADKMEYLLNYFPNIDKDILPYKTWIEESAWTPIQQLIQNNPVNTFPEIWTEKDLETLITVRFSNPNQETFMHFDAVWNTFVQVYGQKLFILSSPNNVMYNYPVLHPHSGHSQLDHIWNYTNYTNSMHSYSNAANDHSRYYPHFGMDIIDELYCHLDKHNCSEANNDITLSVVLLNPGDMLLIPPYWWHHVISLTDSISLHFWLNSEEYLLANRDIYLLPLPFESDWSLSLRIYLLRVFFKLIIQTFHHKFRISSDVHLDVLVFQQLYHLRYEVLMLKQMINTRQKIHDEVYNVCSNRTQFELLHLKNVEPIFMDLVLSEHDLQSIGSMFELKVDDDNIRDRLWIKLNHSSSEISDQFLLIQEASSQLLLLQNYIEYVLNVVLGTEYVIPFLQLCTERY